MFSDKSVGHLTLIIGPMYSGKSTRLINYARKFKIINKKFLIFKHNIDTRYDTDFICSHNLDKEPCICIDDVYKIFDHLEYNKTDVIIIEEGQFFPILIEPIKQMIDIDNKIVIISGLNGDSNREQFGDINNLIPHCDNIEYCTSLCKICSNGTPAIFSKKIIINNTDQILVGSYDHYIAVCRYHYNN